MKILNITNNETDIVFEVEVDSTLWNKTVKNQKQGMIKNIKVDGFRKGKTPVEIAEKYLNYQDLFNKAINKIINPTLDEIEKSKEYTNLKEDITSNIDLDVVDVNEDKLVLKYIFEKYPTFKKFNYKTLDISKIKKEKINDKLIAKTINDKLSIYKTTVDKKGDVLEKGDIAVFDFTGYKDGEKFSGGNAQNYELEIGSNQFIPGFEDQMIGLKIGEEKDLNLKFPDNYHSKDLAGKDVVFKVKLNGIKTSSLPVLDDEFFKTHDEFKNIAKNEEEYKKYVTKELENQLENDYQNNIRQEIINQLFEHCQLDFIPPKMLEKEYNVAYEQYKKNFEQQYKMKLDDVYKMLGENEKNKMMESLRENTKKELILSLIFEHIVEQEKISITPKEREQYIIKQLNITDKQLEELSKKDDNGVSKLDQYINANQQVIDSFLLNQKVWDLLLKLYNKK